MDLKLVRPDDAGSLKDRWTDPAKYGVSVSAEEIKERVLHIIGIDEDWKEKLHSYLEEIKFPFAGNLTQESVSDDTGGIFTANVDLRGIDLSGEEFHLMKYRDIDLTKNKYYQMKRMGDFRGLHLEHARLDGCIFEEIDMRGSYFDNASMRDSHFNKVNLRDSSLIMIDAENTSFRGSYIKNSNLMFSNLVNSDMRECNLDGINFLGSRMSGIKIEESRINSRTLFTRPSVSYYLHKKHYYVPAGIIQRGGEDVYRYVETDRKFNPEGVVYDPAKKMTHRRRWVTNRFSVIEDEHGKISKRRTYENIKEDYRQIKLLMQEYGFYIEADNYLFLELSAKRKSTKNIITRSVLLFLELLTGYGIKLERMIFLAVAEILSFSLIYFIWADFIADNLVNASYAMSILERAGRSVYFSIVTFSTVGYGDLHPIGFMRFVANAEALLGLVVMGLFIVSLTRKFMGS